MINFLDNLFLNVHIPKNFIIVSYKSGDRIMNISTSINSKLSEAMISMQACAVDVSQWFNSINNIYISKVERLKKRKKWIDFMIKLRKVDLHKKIEIENENVTKSILGDATRFLWTNLTHKLLLQTRLNNLREYYSIYDRCFVQRRNNIRIQWKVYAHVLLYGVFPTPKSYRDLWISYAFILKKRKLREISRKLHENDHYINNKIKEQEQDYSYKILSKFFSKAIIKIKANKAAQTVASFNCNYSFVTPLVQDSCLKIHKFVKLWMNKKAQNFSTAYADETYKTSFVHLINKVSGPWSP